MDQMIIAEPAPLEPPAPLPVEARKPAPPKLTAEQIARGAKAKLAAAAEALVEYEAAHRDAEAERAQNELRARLDAAAEESRAERERLAELERLRAELDAVRSEVGDARAELPARCADAVEHFVKGFEAIATANVWAAKLGQLQNRYNTLYSKFDWLGGKGVPNRVSVPTDVEVRRTLRQAIAARLVPMGMNPQSFCGWLLAEW